MTTDTNISLLNHILQRLAESENRYELKLKLPRALTSDRQARSNKTSQVTIVSFVELATNAGHVEITTTVHNCIKDHRLRVLFPTGIETEHSLAGMPFDVPNFPSSRRKPMMCPKPCMA